MSWPSRGLPTGVWCCRGEVVLRRSGGIDVWRRPEAPGRPWTAQPERSLETGPDSLTLATTLVGEGNHLYSWRRVGDRAELMAFDRSLQRRWSRVVALPTLRGLACRREEVAVLGEGRLHSFCPDGTERGELLTSAREVAASGEHLFLGGENGLERVVDLRAYAEDPAAVGGLAPIPGGLLYRVAGATRVWTEHGMRTHPVAVGLGAPAVQVGSALWVGGPPGGGVYRIAEGSLQVVGAGRTLLSLAAAADTAVALWGTGAHDLQVALLEGAGPSGGSDAPPLSTHLAWDGSALWVLGGHRIECWADGPLGLAGSIGPLG